MILGAALLLALLYAAAVSGPPGPDAVHASGRARLAALSSWCRRLPSEIDAAAVWTPPHLEVRT